MKRKIRKIKIPFSRITESHHYLLGESEKRGVVKDALGYINWARSAAGSNPYTTDERYEIRAYLRYWHHYINKRTGRFPDTSLPPGPKPTRRWSWRWMSGFPSISLLVSIIALVWATNSYVRAQENAAQAAYALAQALTQPIPHEERPEERPREGLEVYVIETHWESVVTYTSPDATSICNEFSKGDSDDPRRFPLDNPHCQKLWIEEGWVRTPLITRYYLSAIASRSTTAIKVPMSPAMWVEIKPQASYTLYFDETGAVFAFTQRGPSFRRIDPLLQLSQAKIEWKK